MKSVLKKLLLFIFLLSIFMSCESSLSRSEVTDDDAVIAETKDNEVDTHNVDNHENDSDEFQFSDEYTDKQVQVEIDEDQVIPDNNVKIDSYSADKEYHEDSFELNDISDQDDYVNIDSNAVIDDDSESDFTPDPVIVTDILWPENFGEAHVALWKDDKLGAISITIDDNMAPDHEWWIEQGDKYGFKFTWFVITERPSPEGPGGFWGDWDDFKALYNLGHDIQSHTVSHLHGEYTIVEEYADSREEYNEIIKKTINDIYVFNFYLFNIF